MRDRAEVGRCHLQPHTGPHNWDGTLGLPNLQSRYSLQAATPAPRAEICRKLPRLTPDSRVQPRDDC